MLALAPAGMAKISIAHTDDLRPGDRIHIGFPFGSGGYFLFGGEETFTIVRTDPGKGVTFVDEDGQVPSRIPMPIRGSYDELVGKLREKTSVSFVDVYRPLAVTNGLPPALVGYTLRRDGVVLPGARLARKLAQGYFIVEVKEILKKAGKVEYRTELVSAPAALPGGPRAPGDVYLYDEDAIHGKWQVWQSFGLNGTGIPVIPIMIGVAVLGGGIALYLYLKGK